MNSTTTEPPRSKGPLYKRLCTEVPSSRSSSVQSSNNARVGAVPKQSPGTEPRQKCM